MKKKIIIPFLVIILGVIATCGFLYFKAGNKPLDNDGKNITIIVSEGDTLYNIFQDLNNEKVMNNVSFAKLYIKTNNINTDVRVGRYEIPDDVDMKELISILGKGTSDDEVRFTIPEGYNIEDIANKLDEEGIVTKEDFLEAVKNYKDIPDYIKKDDTRRYQLEGYLFPDTYSFQKGVTSNHIIDSMLKQFNTVFNDILKELNIDRSTVDIDNIVTKASVIEEEAKSDEDRYLISSVIDNRIKKNMMLQIDATVIYAHGYHKEVLYNKDLTIDSKYNTYKYYGLPVGPISNPGKESIKAAMQPKETNYIYYIWTGKGNTHFFTDSYSEFLEKKREANL